MAVVSKNGGIRMMFAWLVVVLALLLPVWFMAGGLGTKFGFWDYGFGLGTMTFQIGPKLIFGVLGLAALSLVLGLIKSPRVKIVILSLVALLIAGLILGRIAGFRTYARSIPAIHDIQTDWSDPVYFSDEMMARREGANPVLDDPTVPGSDTPYPEAQLEAYPNVRTLILRAPPEVTYAAAYTTLDELGLEIVTEDEAGGMLEAIETSFWYGFKDDVVIRIRPQGEGSRVDVRSVSRVGRSDLGANAARIRAILESLSTKLDVMDMPAG